MHFGHRHFNIRVAGSSINSQKPTRGKQGKGPCEAVGDMLSMVRAFEKSPQPKPAAQAQAVVGHLQRPNGFLATTVTFAQSVVADETWPMALGLAPCQRQRLKDWNKTFLIGTSWSRPVVCHALSSPHH